MQATTDLICRHLSRPRLFSILQPLARCKRAEEHIHRHWGHTGGLSTYNDTHVHLRQTRSNVDRSAQFDGAILVFWHSSLDIFKCLHYSEPTHVNDEIFALSLWRQLNPP